MSLSFEIWSSDESSFMWDSPRAGRIFEIQEEASTKLLLRFEARNIDEARSIYQKFLFGGNPDGHAPLNIPAETFFLDSYPCGLKKGDRLQLKENYPLIHEGHSVDVFFKGTILRVATGDNEFPHLIVVEAVEFPDAHIARTARFQMPSADLSQFSVKL